MKYQKLEQRFWSKVEKTDYCWNWIGALSSQGYGVIWYKGRNVTAHRMVIFLTTGKFPKLDTLHHCDNTKCVRPDHLFEGTQKDNIQDAVSKDRMSHKYNGKGFQRGEKHHLTDLTDIDISNIRALYNDGEVTQKHLATLYNVHQTTISNIIRNKTRVIL